MNKGLGLGWLFCRERKMIISKQREIRERVEFGDGEEDGDGA